MNNYSPRTPLDHQDCSVRQESHPEFHQIASSRFLLSATSESTSRLMPSSDVTITWKPGSDFDWLIV